MENDVFQVSIRDTDIRIFVQLSGSRSQKIHLPIFVSIALLDHWLVRQKLLKQRFLVKLAYSLFEEV